MPFLISTLVGLMVLPASIASPIAPSAGVASTTVAVTTAPTSFKPVVPGTKEANTPFTVKLTAYNAVPSQTDGNPFVTASGSFSNPEVVAARSGDLAKDLPFGTIIAITRSGADTPSCNYGKVQQQIGYRVIADAMNPRITNTVDVLLDQNDTVTLGGKEVNPGKALGICGKVTIRVVGHIAVKDIPDTQDELAAYVTPSVLATR
jgi:3D (Asp-Asp-Asp) domain-containing protein